MKSSLIEASETLRASHGQVSGAGPHGTDSGGAYNNQSLEPQMIQPSAPLRPKIFMNVEEAAQRLGVTAGGSTSVQGATQSPHGKLGKFVRFTEEDLGQILEAAARGTLQ